MAEPAQRSVAFAKTTRPAIGSIVHRERLFARLDGSPGRTSAWISGPPGSGKTTLAASYVSARGYRCLWYQLDPDDADIATFFHFLGHAARRLDAARPRDLPAFTPQYGAEIASFSRNFFRRLFARAKAPFALVLDNLHAVPPDSALHAALDAALSQVPKGCAVVVTSRSDPPASLARLQLSGELAHVGWEGLRLEPQETVEIAKLRGYPLAGDAVAQLQERTQGWAAGLVLMLEHSKLSGRIADPPGDGAPQVVFDYLAGEIFERFEAKTQQFLLRVGCLPRMTAEVAQALTGEAKAARLLLNLALNHYFVDEVQADEGRVFQLHPLLREFLRRRAAQDLPEALGAGALRRAAALLRAAGQYEDAVSLSIECGDWAEVARVAAQQADAMLEQGRSETLGRWLEMLPPVLLDSDPVLLHALGTCRAHASPRAARRLFERAHAGFRRAQDARGAVRSCCGLIDATIMEFDNLAPLDEWIGVLAEATGTGSAGPMAMAALMRASLLRNPSRIEDGCERLRAAGSGAELALARAAAALLRGEFAACAAAIGEWLPRAGELRGREMIAVRLVDALHHLLAGRHREALAGAHSGLAAADSEGMHAYDAWLRALAAAAALGADDRDAARGELQRLESGGAGLRRGDRAALHYLRGWLAVLDGDRAGAHREARTAVQLAVETGMPWLECLARSALAQMLAGAGDRQGSQAQLRAAGALCGRLGGALAGFAVQLAASVSALEAKDETAALGSLQTAFSLGRSYGFQHLPWWPAQEVAELCALALRRGVEPEFARGLVRARRLLPRTAPLRVRAWPWPLRIRALGRFELLREDRPVEVSAKGPGRPMELLKVLLANGGQDVRADQLADALWPHVDADFAYRSFTATLHRLRRLLGEEDALLLRDARLSLNPALLWPDTWALDQVLAELDGALRATRSRAPEPALHALVDEALALYRGPFLPDESEQPSYIACREQIRARLHRCLARAARCWEEAGEGESAADCYQRCIEADSLFEAPYRNLMLCYQRGGDLEEARATYERLRTTLAARLRTMPSPETQAVYAGLT